MNERDVRHDRRAPAERVVDLGLARGVSEVIVTADDMGDAHIVVIDHNREHVSRRAVRTQQHEIVEVFILPYDPPLHLILDHGLARQRCFEPDHRLNSRGGRSAPYPTRTSRFRLLEVPAQRPPTPPISPPGGPGSHRAGFLTPESRSLR